MSKLLKAHEQNKLKVGAYYLVHHALLQFDGHLKQHLVPIIPLLHADKQFSVSHKHYHIDARFRISKAVQNTFKISNGYTNAVICPEANVPYEVISIVEYRRKCIQEETGIIPPFHRMHSNSQYVKWYNGYIGQSCRGKKCPHLGASMIEANGRLFCPLHDLHADIVTETIIEHPDFPDMAKFGAILTPPKNKIV